MFNPLLEDMSQLKDSDIDARLTDLNKKYNISLRMGNGAVAQQLVIVIEAVRYEILRRQQEASKKLLEKQNKDIDGLINVG